MQLVLKISQRATKFSLKRLSLFWKQEINYFIVYLGSEVVC